MGRPRLTERAKIEVIAMRKQNKPISEIAEYIGASTSTVHNILRRFELTGSIAELPRSGRPRISTPEEDEKLVKILKDDRKKPAHLIAPLWKLSSGHVASPRTVSARFQSMRYDYKVAVRKPRLSREQKKARLKWCKLVQFWDSSKWRRVIFSDEMNIEVDVRKSKIYIRRLPSEKYDESCIVKRTKQGSGSIEIWAA